MNEFVTFFTNTLSLAVPLVLAGFGGLLSERSGVMNIALEGKLLVGACAAAVVGALTGNPYLGMAAALVASTVLSLAHAELTQRYRMDHIVAGMALNLIAIGATNYVSKLEQFSQTLSGVVRVPQAVLASIILVLIAVVMAVILRGRGGLHLWAVGEDPVKARLVGLNPVAIRYLALLGTGLFCGLGGTWIMANASGFTDGMTAGRGFIALAALVLVGWRPLPLLAACLVFGAVQSLQLVFQGVPIMGTVWPSEVWAAMPYAVTLLALAGFAGSTKPPAGLGVQ